MRNGRWTKIAAVVAALIALFASAPASAQFPYPSKTDLRFDHWYDYAEMTAALHALAAAYPKLVTVESTFGDGDEILIGTRLMAGYRLEINFVAETVLLRKVESS